MQFVKKYFYEIWCSYSNGLSVLIMQYVWMCNSINNTCKSGKLVAIQIECIRILPVATQQYSRLRSYTLTESAISHKQQGILHKIFISY